jgi:hypothetical protein
MISGNVQNLLLEENLDDEDNGSNILAGTIEKGMRTVLSTVSRASPASFNIKDTSKLLQPPSNRIGTLRHRSTSHTGTAATHQPDTISHENNKKIAESKDAIIEDKTVSSSSDDKFEQVRLLLYLRFLLLGTDLYVLTYQTVFLF